ncbi:MAG: helix-turn-helix transcriptional regulator [Ruminococcus sp.]
MDKKSRHCEKYVRLGLNIAYYRKLRGLTQLQLAEAVDISRTHMSNIEAPNVETSVSLDTLFDIADKLQIPIKDLFEFSK